MKIFRLSALSAATAILLWVTPSAIGSVPHRVGQYDFTYLTSGELRATPVQVFDDGKSTYFQFRAGEAIPAIFQNKDGKVDLLVPAFEGPYVRVTEVSGRFTLQLGRAQAQVVYGGAGREGTPSVRAIARNGMATPYDGNGYPADRNVKLVASLGPATAYLNADSLEANSYATPVKGDRVAWKDSETRNETLQVWFGKSKHELSKIVAKQLAASREVLRNATRITVVGRDDDSYKEGLEQARATAIREELVKLGIESKKIVVKTGVGIDRRKDQWASDIRIETVMPTSIARPADTTSAGQSEKSAYVRSNLEGLIKSGVITREQADAILRKGQEDRKPQAGVAEAPPVRNTEVPTNGFDFRAGDKQISNTMRRWAAATNYQLVWEAPATADAPVTGDAVIASASMKEALDKVVTALQRKGYDIQATVYSNRVIRFTGSSK